MVQQLTTYFSIYLSNMVFPGWLALGTVMMLFAFLISMFPKKLPPRTKQVNQMSGKDNAGITLDVVDKPTENGNGVSKTNNNGTVVKPKPAEAETTDLPQLKGEHSSNKDIGWNYKIIFTTIKDLFT